MSAIPCASVNLRTMADGTLRICLDIEPAHAQDAFKLFAAPGTPAAIAALQVGYEAKSDMAIPATDKPKGGALSKLAGRWCQDPEFWAWINGAAEMTWPIETSDHAAEFVRDMCGIESRAELDHDEVAAENFHRLIRGPFAKYTQSRG
jgi:hypothetical protein